MRLVNLVCNEISINQIDNIDGSRGHYSIEMNQAPSSLIGDESNGWLLYESIINQGRSESLALSRLGAHKLH